MDEIVDGARVAAKSADLVTNDSVSSVVGSREFDEFTTILTDVDDSSTVGESCRTRSTMSPSAPNTDDSVAGFIVPLKSDCIGIETSEYDVESCIAEFRFDSTKLEALDATDVNDIDLVDEARTSIDDCELTIDEFRVVAPFTLIGRSTDDSIVVGDIVTTSPTVNVRDKLL